MKTDNDNKERTQHAVSLHQLLADVEHAGRDERRQQELGAMIDRMAGENGERRTKNGEHGAWWWVSRVAAAACVLFFIGTAVRVWFIPTESSSSLVAEAEVPVVEPVAGSRQPVVTAVAAPAPRRIYARPQNAVMEPLASEEQVDVEEYVAENMEVVEPIEAVSDHSGANDPKADIDTIPNYIILDDFAPDAELIVQTVEPKPIADPSVKPDEPAKPARRRSIFSLFRAAEPSMMEGTTLALLQF